MRRHLFRWLVPSFAAVFFFAMVTTGTARRVLNRTEPAQSLKLYVFECGTIHVANTELFSLKKEEVATSDLAVPCFLIVHPKGTLLWDARYPMQTGNQPALQLRVISSFPTTGNGT